MPVGVRFDTNKTFVKSLGDTKQVITNIPEVEEEISEGIARDLENAIKRSVSREFDGHSGELKSNVDARKTKTSDGASFEVTANAYNNGVNYAAWHEFADTGHFVPFYYRNRVYQPITTWAKERGLDDGRGITVRPLNQREGHGFMGPAVKEAISNTRKLVRSGKTPFHKELAKAYGD